MNLSQHLGWTLVHSLWEIELISMILLIAGVVVGRADARMRYVLALAALSGCLICPIATYLVLAEPSAAPMPTPMASPQTPVKVAPIVSVMPIVGERSEPESLDRRLEPYLPTLVICWLVGLCLMCVRLGGGLLAVERMKRNARTEPSRDWVEIVHSLGSAMGIRRLPDLKLSHQVDSPAVVGAIKTVILLPAAAVTKLSTSDVEALLAHELAHVVRNDYLANLIQTVIETVLFYHPCIWWISSIVRTEREHCCDDIAVSVLGDRNRYASALIGLEQLRQETPRLAMGANGGPLALRIRRVLLMPQRSVVPESFWLALLFVCTIAAGLGYSQGQLPSHSKAKETEEISGRVTDIDGKSIANATVLWQDSMIPSSGFHIRAVKTDARGMYRFTNMPSEPGTLIAFQKHVGFGSLLPYRDSGHIIQLQRTKPVRVRVMDTAGRPVAAIRVGPSSLIFDNFACNVSPEALNWLGSRTDENGRATLDYIPEYSSATLDVQDDRYTSKLQDGASELTYTRENRVVIAPACTVVGTLSMEGKPVSHASIFAVPAGKWNPTGDVATDANGRFELRRQPKCTLKLTCFLPEALTEEWIVRPANVATNPKQPAHVDFRLEHGVKISGLVLNADGKPAPRISVSFSLPNVARGIEAAKMTGPDGMFKAAVLPGTYEVRLLGRGGIQSESMLTVREGESKFLRLAVPAKSDELQTKKFTCTVLDADGRARRGIEVQCSCKNTTGREEERFSLTNSKGEASFELPTKQAATVSFKASLGNQFSDGLIPAVNGKATIRLRKVALGSVSGVVLDSNGRPISGVKLDLGINGRQPFVGDLREMHWTNNTTGSDGSFKYTSIYPGTPVVVMVHANGFADAQSSGVRVIGGKDIQIPPLRLAQGRTVSGKVIDREGNPIVGATVWVEKIVKVSDTMVHTDHEGTFLYTRVPVGKHTLWISSKGHEQTFPITKEAGAIYQLSR